MITKFKLYESLDIDIDITISHEEVKIYFYFSNESILYWLDVHVIEEEYFDDELFNQNRNEMVNKKISSKALNYLKENY